MSQAIGERFARAVSLQDDAELRALLDPAIDFAALTPGRSWEAHSADEVVDVVFGTWFGEHDRIDALDAVETGTVEDRGRFSYRVRITNTHGEFMVEQQAYVDVVDDRITWLRILCSGHRRVSVETDA